MDFAEPPPERPQHRRYVAAILIGVATAQVLGATLRMPSQLEANDKSRWCTVWALLERGTYAIDDCPWQSQTQDKVFKLQPARTVAAGGVAQKHYYSSKPPLLPTLIAGLLYPFRAWSGVPLDASVEQRREPRYVPKPDPDAPGKTKGVLETPAPAPWPAYVFYFKPVIVLINVVPYLIMLFGFARFLDRHAPDDWSWIVSLAAAAFGTPLFLFATTLNNHSVAAACAAFAVYALVRIWDDGEEGAGWFVAAGFFGAMCACNELPAALFGVLLFLMLLMRFPRKTLVAFVPAAIVPCAAFLATQYLATGQVKPVYSEFGTDSYNYEGSYWNTPLEMDWFDKHPEPRGVYLMHMVVGHHGLLSLTPILVFSLWGALRNLFGGGERRLAAVSALTLALTAGMLAFYAWKSNNYGGSTQALRWLIWLFPLWMVALPAGLEGLGDRAWTRRLSLAALMGSVFSIGYGFRNPWSHPWALDLLEHLNFYVLKR